MSCKPTNIKITEGNAFALICPIRSRQWQGVSQIDENIDPTLLQNVVVKVNGVSWADFELTAQGVVIAFPAELKKDTYNVEIAATYNDIAIRAAYFEAFTIVAWSYQSDAENYVPESQIVADAAYCVAGNWTDEELDELKADYRAAIAEAEAAKEAADEAKEDYDEKAEQLDGIAQQTTLTAVQEKIGTPAIGQAPTLFQAIAEAGGGQFPTDYAKQGNNASATLTATQTAATNAASYAETAKNAVVDGNDTAITAIKDVRSKVGTGSDTAAESGTLFAVVKWVKDKVKSIFNLIGSPASGQPSTLFAAIAAGGGGGGGDAQESTSQAILTAVNTLVNSHIVNGVSFEGWIFQHDYSPTSFGDAMAHLNELTSVYDESITEVVGFQGFLGSALNLTSLSLPNLVNINTEHFCDLQNGYSVLTTVNLPKLRTVYTTGTGLFGTTAASELKSLTLPALVSMYQNTFRQCQSAIEIHLPECTEMRSGGMNFWVLNKLEIIDLPKMSSDYVTSNFNGNSIIDIIIGQNFTSNANMSSWNPSTALSSTSTSLVKSGETFTSNLEKLLYNIRNHMAANLPDRTGQSALTITFSSAVKAAIQADTATAQAFSNKNWTIA